MRLDDTNQLRTTTTELMGPKLQQLQQIALVMVVVGAVLCGVGFLTNLAKPARFWEGFYQSYLFAYQFWIGVTAGSLGLLMLHHVVGGGWGFIIRRFLEAATRLFWPMLLLFVPVVFGLLGLGIDAEHRILYPWAGSEALNDPLLRAKAPYLNAPFFLFRTLIYFGFWIWFASRLNKLGDTQDHRADREVSGQLNFLGALGMLLYVIVATFMAVDWVMSLEPHWFSSIFGLLFVASHGLSTLALMLVLLGFLAGDRGLVRGLPDGYFRDLGNLLLAFVLLWAYMSFSQYLITFSGNTAEEVSWYVHRREKGWGFISLALIPFHFALPFLILLVGSPIKRSPRRLAGVAFFIVLMRFVDLFWLVAPTFRYKENVYVTFADFGTPLLIGGIWLALWARELRDKPVVPLHDPRLEGALQEAAAHG